MSETSAPSPSKEGDSSSSSEGGRIWQGLKALLFGDNGSTSLRHELESVIEQYDDQEDETSRKGDLTPIERQMLRNMLHFSEHTVDDVAVPRADIIAISQDASFTELMALFAQAGHSRIPVYKDTLDHVTGMIHIRDAFAILARGEAHPESLETLIRQPLYVPQSMGVLDLLAEMRAKRTHLAIVLDEYSGTDGLLTIEDLVEEIVGDIEDEHDEEPEALLVPLEDGMWDADARAELEDIARTIDPRLAEVDSDVDTIGGLAFVIAGRVPETGEFIEHEPSGWRIEIVEANPRHVARVRLHPPEALADDLEQ
ncbi:MULTISPECIES: hemolysin family protein [Sphingobium]|uniref:hemolysin family protein n=1 Tax=Sphingobium TaxID=165695 RepID=UPI0015EBEF62|nr:MULTISPECIES: hemolysin family protein [Sphingobium]MCW2361427.1 CBS domain containing-hemolysin-like protein [Sphingobium sp. B10D3B]MCW2387678.1 CBS domain containing-hemolysin-like protein [Sphingobium sp. B11D3B]MCW2401894.1 CBS domain containing-hemolysin-like protein [Sphingobium sp. B10D7B]MCW2408873.1 CBS domain containing-hemolysin-like protein [Sphingobium xanthum]